jgi:GT2 family glycosyltransferase
VVAYIYNYAHYLDEAIQSILDQTFSDFELFILDDGSTDGTGELLQKYLIDPRVRYEYQQNKGRDRLHETFNRCLEATAGEYIVIANGDDLLHPEKIQRQLEVFQAYPDVDVVIHDATLINGNGEPISGSFDTGTSEDLFAKRLIGRYMFARNLVPNPTAMFRRSILRQIGLQEYGWMHDYQFWLKAAVARCRFYFLPDKLLQYRVHEQSHSTSSVRQDRILEEGRRMRREMRQRYSIEEIFPEISLCSNPAIARAHAHLELGVNFCRGGDPVWDLAVSEFKMAQELAPDIPEVKNNLAIALYLNGQKDEAIRNFQDLAASQSLPAAEANLDLALTPRSEWQASFILTLPASSPLPEARTSIPEGEDPREEVVQAAFLAVLDRETSDQGVLHALQTFFATSEGHEALVILTDIASDADRLTTLFATACQQLGLDPEHTPEVVLQQVKPEELESVFLGQLLGARAVLEMPGGRRDARLSQLAQVRGVSVLNSVSQRNVQDFLLLKPPTTSAAAPISPLVSVIVPTYNRPKMLASALNSILNQTYPHVEVIVVNDGGSEVESLITSLDADRKITYVRIPRNRERSFARNVGISVARGKYIAYLDDDDCFYPDHLATLVKFLETSDYRVAYTDAHRAHQVMTEQGYQTVSRDLPYSHDFNFHQLLVHNLFPTLTVMHERACLDEVGLFDESLETHEDWDLWIRLARKFPIHHLAKVTSEFSFRTDGSSTTSSRQDDFLKTLEMIYQKHADLVTDLPHVRQAQMQFLQLQRAHLGGTGKRFRVSIVIPVFNQVDYTRRCLEVLSENTPSGLYEVVIVDNGSTDGTHELLTQLEGDVRVISNESNLGFAKACNQGAAAAGGEILLFLNNDTEPHPGWLEGMLKVLETEPKVGALGNKLLFPDGTIQHAGVIFRHNAVAHHWLYQADMADHPLANQQRDFQCVTGACVAIPRQVFEKVGGFDEGYVNGCEDIDLCLKIRKAGYRVIYTPQSVVTHVSSVSEGRLDHDEANLERLIERWGKEVLPDASRYQAIAEGRNPTYSVVVVTYNSQATIEACLQSVLTTLGADDEVLVVDNSSVDQTVDIVSRLVAADARVKLIPSSRNLGFSEGCNLGLRRAVGQYLVLLNPDTVVTTGWLERMRAHFDSGNVGAVGPTSDYVAGHQKVGLYLPLEQISGRTPAEVAALLARRGSVGVPTKLLIGFCMMIPREILEEVGLLDPILFLGNDDLDLSWRLRQKGYQLMVASDVFVHHRGQVSFNTEPSSKTKKLVQESTDALARKLVAHYGVGKVPSSVELWGMDWFIPSEGILKAAETTSIVVLTFNQLEVTKLCVDSLFMHTRDFELVIVDNASTDGTVPYLKALAAEHDNIKLILNVNNRGFAGGCNQGIAASTGSHVVLLNNDTVVSEGWLDGLIQAAATEGVGIVGPRTNCIVGPQQVNEIAYDPQTLQGFETFAREWRAGNRNIWQTTRVIGFCMVIRRDVIDQIGGLDTTFGTGNFEDDDYCLRAQVAGFKIAVTDAVFIHHFGSVTFKGQKVDYRRTMDRNWALFKRKWGLPDSMPLEGGYRAAEIISQPFESVRHTVPVFSSQAIPAELPDRRGYNLLLSDDDGERLSCSIKAYLEAFQEQDDVALHVLAGQDLGRAEATIMEVLAELHRDPARIPDISLLDAPRSPLDLPGYLKAADLVLGSPAVASGARDMGLPAFTEPNAELLRTAREQFRTSDWSERSLPFEGPRELWLVGENWEDAMEAYLQAVKPGMEVSLLLRVPPGAAEKSQEVVAEWLVEHGHDPEKIPDVVLVDQPSSVSVFRQATAWIDTGEPLGRAIALALGIRIIVPEAIADAVRLISPAHGR